MNLDTDFLPFTEINSKWFTDLTVKHKTIKLLEDNIGENLDELVFCKDFVDTKPRSMKKRTDKMDFIKIKNFCPAKDSQEHENTSHRMGENICKIHIEQMTFIQNMHRTQTYQ